MQGYHEGMCNWCLSGAKFAVIGFMDALRMETFDRGIVVTNVCPGCVTLGKGRAIAPQCLPRVVSLRCLVARPVDTAVSRNSLTADGSKFGITLHGNNSQSSQGIMTADRCAQIILHAAAAKREEAWIANQPILAALYLNQFVMCTPVSTVCRCLVSAANWTHADAYRYAPWLGRTILKRKAPASITAFKQALQNARQSEEAPKKHL